MLAHSAYRTRQDLGQVAAIGIVTFLSVVVLFRLMGTTMLQSDVLGYSEQSHHWWQASMHLPGYAILLWLSRMLTFGAIDDVLLMQAISLAAWGGSIWVFLQIAERINPSAARWGAVSTVFTHSLGSRSSHGLCRIRSRTSLSSMRFCASISGIGRVLCSP